MKTGTVMWQRRLGVLTGGRINRQGQGIREGRHAGERAGSQGGDPDVSW